MKLLIVDDEAIIRSGLRAMISRMPPLDTVTELYEAEDGRSALEAVKKYTPDIILLDIRMPYMDGLEFMRAYSEMHRPGKIIVLSGYGEFEYTREALRSGAADYLLKPVKREALYEALRRTMQELLHTRDRVRAQQARLDAMQSHLCAQGLTQLLLETGKHPKPLTDFLNEYGTEFSGSRYRVIYAVIRDTAEDAPEAAMTALLDSLSAVFPASLCTELSESSAVCISEESRFPPEPLRKQLDRIVKMLRAAGSDTVFGVSESGKIESDPVRGAYRQARSACMERFVSPSEFCFFHEVIAKASAPAMSEKDCAALLYKLRQHDEAGIRKTAAALFDQLTEKGYSFRAYLECLTSGLWDILSQEKHGLSRAQVLSYLTYFADAAPQCDSLDELTALFAGMLNEHISVPSSDGSELYRNKAVELAKKYIAAHYCEELTLGKIADYVGMNPSYFSVLFKKVNRVGLVDYINDVRVEQAVALLSDPQCRIYEAALRVGFTDDKYFSRVFKKKMGVSPSEWRRNC